MTPAAPSHSTVPERDTFSREGRLVHKLISQAGPANQRFLPGHAQTWLDAFRLFRELENSIGLPESREDRYAYYVLLTALVETGKYIHSKLDDSDAVLHEMTGVSCDAFEGCVKMLEDSLSYFNRNFSPGEINALGSKIFGPDAETVA